MKYVVYSIVMVILFFSIYKFLSHLCNVIDLKIEQHYQNKSKS